MLAFGLLLLAGPAVAQVFYDNLGNVDVFEDDDVVLYIGDHTSALGGADWFQGHRFTSEATGEVASIDVAVGNYFDGPDTMQFRLYTDVGGTLGTLLATFTVIATAEQFDGSIRRGRVDGGFGTPVLAQGTNYWLMASATGPTLWFQNEQGDVLPRLWTPDGIGAPLNSDTTAATGFRVNGPPPVPMMGPGAMAWLVALGSATGLWALGRRRSS